MQAVRTSLIASDLPESLSALRSEIERNIPHGRTDNGGPGDRGAWGNPVIDKELADHLLRFKHNILPKHPKLSKPLERAANHCGTLGGGK